MPTREPPRSARRCTGCSNGRSPARRCRSAHVRAAAREFALDPQAARAAPPRWRSASAPGEGAWAWDAAALDWHGNEVTLIHEGRRCASIAWCAIARAAPGGCSTTNPRPAPSATPALIAQLQRYRDAVQDAYPGETVRAAFLTGQGELVTLE